MLVELHHDFETFSSIDITKCGSYKYFESPDFEILMVTYKLRVDGVYKKAVQFVPAEGEEWPQEYIDALLDPTVEKHAHNANFERNALKVYGYDIPASEWRCSAVKAGYCGLPMSLDGATKALNMGDDGKSAEGKALIRYFSCLVRPTKANGGRYRNMWYHNPEKWEAYKRYNRKDVAAETKMLQLLEPFTLPQKEYELYALDQKINDRGVNVDVRMAVNAISIDEKFNKEVTARLKQLTGLVNPNSSVQLCKWLSTETQKDIKSIAKDVVQDLIKELKSGTAVEVLKLRVMASKTSTKKYETLVKCALLDWTAHGLLQIQGAGRTGRWAGRLLQIHNLPRNKMKLLDFARQAVKDNDYELLQMFFEDLPKVLSELIRTVITASKGRTLAVADYSAIEGRITAWLAGEKWRLDVFAGDGKIYEASAAMMFGVPVESIGKGSEYRDKGKIAELALGFGGSVGALAQMGGEAMGLSQQDMQNIVARWRKASPNIVNMWYEFERCAIKALKICGPVKSKLKGIVFNYEHKCLTVKLPSGRKLIYREACLTKNRWDGDSIKYKGKDQKTGQWGWVQTYGGKLSENIIQAIARDLLAEGMLRIDKAGFDIVMHVHDEVVCDIPDEGTDFVLSELVRIMGEPVDWAPGLATPAEGFITPYYKKD